MPGIIIMILVRKIIVVINIHTIFTICQMLVMFFKNVILVSPFERYY